MDDWRYAESDPAQKLSRLQHFSFTKKQSDRETEFVITVQEYVSPPAGGMRFFAKADRQTNQELASITPTAAGETICFPL